VESHFPNGQTTNFYEAKIQLFIMAGLFGFETARVGENSAMFLNEFSAFIVLTVGHSTSFHCFSPPFISHVYVCQTVSWRGKYIERLVP